MLNGPFSNQTQAQDFAKIVLNKEIKNVSHCQPQLQSELLPYLPSDLVNIVLSYESGHVFDFEKVAFMWNLFLSYHHNFLIKQGSLVRQRSLFKGEADYFFPDNLEKLNPLSEEVCCYDIARLYEAYCFLIFNKIQLSKEKFPLFVCKIEEVLCRNQRIEDINDLSWHQQTYTELNAEVLRHERDQYFTHGRHPSEIKLLVEIALRYLENIDHRYLKNLVKADTTDHNRKIKNEALEAFKFFYDNCLIKDERLRKFALNSKTVNYQAWKFWGKSSALIEVEKSFQQADQLALCKKLSNTVPSAKWEVGITGHVAAIIIGKKKVEEVTTLLQEKFSDITVTIQCTASSSNEDANNYLVDITPKILAPTPGGK